MGASWRKFEEAVVQKWRLFCDRGCHAQEVSPRNDHRQRRGDRGWYSLWARCAKPLQPSQSGRGNTGEGGFDTEDPGFATVDYVIESVLNVDSESVEGNTFAQLLLPADYLALWVVTKPQFLSASVICTGSSYQKRKYLFTTYFAGNQLS